MPATRLNQSLLQCLSPACEPPECRDDAPLYPHAAAVSVPLEARTATATLGC